MSYSNKKVALNPKNGMPTSRLNDLIKLANIQSSSNNEKMMYHYVCSWLDDRNIPYETDAIGNVLATKGKSDMYPMIASHLDTVHDIHKEFKVMSSKGKDGNLMLSAFSGAKQVGVGGDDKCGIFTNLFMLEKFDNIKAVFFTQEEVGLIGSGNADADWFNDVGYIIQLDRWGASDFISIYGGEPTISDEFANKVENIMDEYSFNHTEGLITDSIGLWSDGIGVSCVNVSCGYYLHHTDDEVIDTNELWNSIMFTYHCIRALGENEYISNSNSKLVSDTSFIDTYDYGTGYEHSDKDTMLYDIIDWDALEYDSLLQIMGTGNLTDLMAVPLDSQMSDDIISEYRLITNRELTLII
jgi:hypothetical protein